MADMGGYQIGDVANGYVLTEHGWTRLEPEDAPAPQQYRIGDVVGAYVLTDQGWRPVGPGGAPPTQPMPAAYPSQPGCASQPGYGPVQPAYRPAPGSRSRKGVWIALAVVAVVLVGGIAAVALALVNARNSIGDLASPTVTSSTASGSASGTGTASAAAEGKTFAFGETAQLTLDGADAAEITVGAPVEFISTNQFDTSEKGRLVYVPVTMKVTGKEKVSINPFDFEVVLPDGQRLDVAFVGGRPKDAPADLDGADVNPGETITGSVAFDVPTGTPLKVAYTPEFEVLGTWQ